MKTHWTERSIKYYLFSIVADFTAQLEIKMESENISQDELAKKLGISKRRVSQILSVSKNISIENIIKFAKALDMDVSIVAYEDVKTKYERGPINSDIFRICWEKSGKPIDFWAFERKE